MKTGFGVLCRFACPALLALTALAAVGCDDSVGGERGQDGTGGSGSSSNEAATGSGGGEVSPPTPVDSLDLLLVIDGSGSMADKQGFLSGSIRPFLERIRNPKCVDGDHVVVDGQPSSPSDPCPARSAREYTADVTVHVGVISSSLGTGTSDVCGDVAGRFNDDRAHLLFRSGGSQANDLETYEGLGFFAWDPGAKLSPAGDDDFDHFAGQVEEAIRGVNEFGCGYEMPLEAMHTFLAEPEPLLTGTDEVDEDLLDQRAAFLRPGSMLHVILLSDENDASFRDDGIGQLGMGSAPDQGGHAMPRPRAECAVNPNDACCVSCIEPIPDGCAGDGGCAAPGDPSEDGNYHPPPEAGGPDDSNAELRAWNQKQRFGIDFLFPVERYAETLGSATLTLGGTTTAPNPVFAGGREASHVFLTVVVGVPWQDVARDPSDASRGFLSAAEMQANGTWDVIVGDPSANVQPTDPLMIESPYPRPGLSTTPESSPINGNEWETDYQDLQYACVFDLPAADHHECVPETGAGCNDCKGAATDNPLCEPSNPLVQIRAQAYPGIRQLRVAQMLGSQANVVPICGTLEEEDVPGPVGTFILETGLEQTAEQLASLMSGVAP